MNSEGPEMEHVVSGEGVSLLNHHSLAAQQGQLDGCSQATRTPTDDQTLNGVKEVEVLISQSEVLCFLRVIQNSD